MQHKIKFKEFKPTSWSIDNKTSIYVLAIIIAVFGFFSYSNIAKEQTPEIVIPYFVVSTIYPGTAPADMENLVTRPIEKNLKSINGVKNITSNSIQDYSSIVVEFNTGIDIDAAKQKVKDAVDKTKSDLPNDLPKDPDVIEINFSEFPIMGINISGNYPMDKLKKYADDLKDRIESLKEITRVDLVGALDREIQIDVDMYRMQAAGVTLGQIEQTVAAENVTVAGGSIDMYGMRRSITAIGEFKNIDELKNVSFSTTSGAMVKLSDIATVRDSFKERESFARMNNQNVITLNVIKKSGQNLLDAADGINTIIDEFKTSRFPKDLKVDITGDQSHYTRNTLSDLNNTIIIGFLLVTLVLMFFMGVTNALFVGFSVPLSMALAYIVMPGIGFTLNMLVMFAFIFALGIVVDDAIVVIENTHRIYMANRQMDIRKAAKVAAGEVFVPILSGTLTTLAPFFPLAFWPGIVGKFMYFIPVTLIITLFASLIVAYIINPVFAVGFMKRDDEDTMAHLARKKVFSIAGIMTGIAAVFYLLHWTGLGTLLLFIMVFYVFHNIIGYKMIYYFQHKYLPWIMNKYEKLLRYVLVGRRPFYFLYGLIVLLIFSFILVGIAKPKVLFFPDNMPNTIEVYLKMPVGTDVKVTDSIAKVIEERVVNVLGKGNPDVESVMANVALSASDQSFESSVVTSNLAKISINFVEYQKRKHPDTNTYMDEIRKAVQNIPGAEITVDKQKSGPPTGKPINIELSSENLDELIATSNNFIRFVDSLNIGGIEELKSDFDNRKPELVIDIDRERANREGITTGQIGSEIRTAVLGKEVSKYRDGEDQYPIELRYEEWQRKDIDRLMNLKITYRDMATGVMRQIPLSSVAKVNYQNTYGGIKRKNLKRVITLSSNVLSGYTANEINWTLQKQLPNFKKSDNVEVKFTGEQEDQKESASFLSKAMMLSLFLILFILITQFNSVLKPIIIITEVIFSITGVLLGYAIFHMSFSVIMTGMGIVALAGIVVRNGILLVEFTDVLRERGLRTREAIVQAGKTRITPVLLTATATILGLIPLAVGFNINFATLLTEFRPDIHIGGDSVAFFGALSWTIIFGLTFATILTLVFIPAMYFIMHTVGLKIKKTRHKAMIVRH
jgi:multidrug efflux pump subunit AcrB